MKKITFLFIILLLQLFTKSFAQNDCVDAIIICGDANLSRLETNGAGIQEITFPNACSSQEYNSIWLKVRIKDGGTFGFLITPESTDLVVDFDFWIFGPNTNCGNLGSSIRCSTTNPLNAQLTSNLTGMNETEIDVSEGPGPNGNSFVNWLNVLDNETYYIAIDRPVGESNFAISWTGTATFYSPPIVENTTDITNCIENSNLETAIFDLTQNTSLAVGNQTNITTSFYTDYNDAITQTNQIANTTNFENTQNPQQIFIRLTNSVTDCFVVADFLLNVNRNLNPNTQFTYKSTICTEEISALPILSAQFTPIGTFESVPNGLQLNPETGNIDVANSETGTYTITYSVDENDSNCYFSQASTFELKIVNCTIPKGISPNNDTLNDSFNLENLDVKQLQIYNRYGIKIYEKQNYKKEWNGLSENGKELPTGTYYYIIHQNNGKIKTGWVYLNRNY